MKWFLNKSRWLLLALATLCLGCIQARAASDDVRPSWVDKSEKALNAMRTNDTYVFKVLRTEDTDLTRLRAERFDPLFEYLAGEYGANPSTMAVDSLSTGGLSTYRIRFQTPSGPASVLARLVEVYESIDYNVVEDPVFEYCQLYAIGRKDADVVFDQFKRREVNRSLAGLMSVVPGAGQLYKGNKGKGYALLGTSLACAGAAVASQYKMVEWRNMMDKDPGNKASWESKSIAMKKQRNVLLGAIGCLSAFSIFDAIVGDEIPRIVVSGSDGTKVSVAPSYYSAGIALHVDF